MRTLLYVSIIHMDVDLGSLAMDVAKRGIRELGEDVWASHKETVSGFWDSISEYSNNLKVSGFKIYQDGMVANGEIGQKIVEEGLKSGSKNYEIVYKLIQRDAVLVKTEDFALVAKERDHLIELTKAKTSIEKLIAYLRYRLIKNQLLKKRDRFIADRVNQTLNNGETGILFIGAYHNIIPMLDKDIHVKEIKEIKKIRDYQKVLLHGRKDRERLEALSEYLRDVPKKS